MRAVVALALLGSMLGACDRAPEIRHHDEIVVVRGQDSPILETAMTASSGLPAQTVPDTEPQAGADEGLPDDDPVREAALTAAREADPDRLAGVDPDELAAAGG
jgi:hypothetical protein